MPYKIGLVGLPNVGKSSLFYFLTKKKDVIIANYPFATLEPSVGLMPLVDPRLKKLNEYWKSQRIVSSIIEIIDIAGLVKGASKGSGLGNEFLSHIREVDLICHVLRCFPEKNIIHVEKSVDPIRDLEIVQLELILADLQQIKKRLEKFKTWDEKNQKEKALLQLIKESLEKEIPVNQINLSESEKKVIKIYNFLTNKPFILLANYEEQKGEIRELERYAQKKNLSFFSLAVKPEIETEKLSLQEKEKIGSQNADFDIFAQKIKKELNLKTFFTVGEDEIKSWLTREEMDAKKCAGLIHSKIEKNFIRAEVYNYNDWVLFLNKEKLKKMGKISREGANYSIKEGDICHFFFSKS